MSKVSEVKAQLKQYLNQATDYEQDFGQAWYMIAHEQCALAAHLLKLPLSTFVGVVAALSPRLKWEVNIRYAIQFCETGQAAALGYNKQCAARILEGEHPLQVLVGPKVRAFYLNILEPKDTAHSTVDTWMIRAAYNRDAAKVKELEYIRKALSELSEELNLTPNQVQAIVWLVVKRLSVPRKTEVIIRGDKE